MTKKLKQNILFLRKNYKHRQNRDTGKISDEWLGDNFHVVEKAYTSAYSVAKTTKHTKLKHKEADMISKMCENGILPDDEEIITFLLQKNVTTAFLCKLDFFIYFALIDILVKSLKSGDEQITINSIKSLVRIQDTDFSLILFEVSETEKILCQDPVGIYRNMDEETKGLYREAVSTTAEKTGKSEVKVAVDALEKAKESNKHIGFFLDLKKSNRTTGKLLIITEAAIPLIAALLSAVFFKAWYLLPLLYLPFWESLKFLTDILSSALRKPNTLPKMDFAAGVPKNAKTVIAISTLLPSAGKAWDMIPHLKDICLSNCTENVSICILADLKNDDTPTVPSDKADIKAMKRVVNRLNRIYGDKFILAVRPRSYSETEREYTGKERKRGALTSLAEFIKTGENEFLTILGNEKNLTDAKYIMALDSDTQMPTGSLISLIEVAEHPLNAPVISYTKQTVEDGYAIIAPRIETSIESATKTRFSSFFSGSGGVPAYSNASGEKYMDFFSESIFSGKGLINVDAFTKLLTDRFPEQRILSHDIPEGMILRTAFYGSAVLTDSFPTNEISYFKRLHRWIRGDIQNIRFILKNKKCKISGDLPKLGKWWLINNIRRSLTHVFAVLSIILSLFITPAVAEYLCVIAVLSAVMPDLFSALITLLKGGISMLSRLYFSSAVPHAVTCILRAVSNEIMLVRSAACSVDAIIRSLFRMVFSKKHLLEWTTAADGEKNNETVLFIKKSLPSLAVGIILTIFGKSILRFLGITFIMDLPFSLFGKQQKKDKKAKLSEDEKNTLLSYCASMWKFYEQYSTEEFNYLIPDNIQESPVFTVADRTSPTNIGLMLCAFLAARDFNFTDTDEMKEMIDKTLSTIEKLKKYKGNLYNWYNTSTLEVLKPEFISCVDSGNFLCCLVALKEGLKHYMAECPSLSETANRIEKIISETDIGFMFDERRNLFFIGYDCEREKFTPSRFDLLMSEARMTSYYAVASGAAPLKHWKALGRTLSENGRYTGPVSWSGTMFEYFMPAIFLPSINNSLGEEALKFCIHCQKKRVKNMNIPYGISESGFFAFDKDLNYQYKAHGVSSLSLRRSPDDEIVISPYSTFLTVPTDPHSGMNNLKKLKKMGMYGKFGFFEAADFTKSRTENKKFSFVRSYMAHHVGMSFLSAANAVFDNIMQKRFMDDDNMAGCKSLLYEKIPSDAKIYKKRERFDAPIRPERMPKIRTDHEKISLFAPNCNLLTNGEWSVFASDSGMNYSVFSGSFVFKNHKNPLGCPDGLFAAVKTDNGEIIPFTKAPMNIPGDNYSCSFTENSVIYKNGNSILSCCETITLHPEFPSEMITFSIKNKTKSKKNLRLMIYAEPSLVDICENVTHPAFSNMFTECGCIQDENLFYFTRRLKNKAACSYITGGFLNKTRFEYSFDRETILGRDKGIFSVFESDFNSYSVSVDKCIALQLEITVAPNSTHDETLILCGAGNMEESVNNIVCIRKKDKAFFQKSVLSPFDMTSIGGVYSRKIIARTFFASQKPKETNLALQNNKLERADLWSMGISGDFPVFTAKTEKNDTAYVNAFIKMHRQLKLSGILTELVLLSDSPADYNDELKNSVIRFSGADTLMTRGGIFIIDTSTLSKDMFTLLLASSTAIYPENTETVDCPKSEPIPVKKSFAPDVGENMFLKNGYIIKNTPFLPWSHIICNNNFGTLITDSSLGYSWCMNSRENKLTPWSNDTRNTDDGERLILKTENGKFDIIKGSVAFFQRGKGIYLSYVDLLEFKTEVTVSDKSMCKTIAVQMKNNDSLSKEFLLSYFILPVLGDTSDNRHFIQYDQTENAAVAYTPYNKSFAGYLMISGDNKCSFAFNRKSFLTETSDFKEKDCIIATEKIYLPGKSEKTIKFYLSYAKNPFAARTMTQINKNRTADARIIIETPDSDLNNIFNNFLPEQIIGGRLYGRVGFYQCSGAYGFRDQLQDAMAIVLTHPEILKIMIFRCCAAQFAEGDVLHWFHEFYNHGKKYLRGVRTNCSDDMLWLPLAVSEYCSKTGDYSVLKAKIPFIVAPLLEKGENEHFGEFVLSEKKDTVFNHCIAAITRACVFGNHSLPLIKSGDWNDSFNAVGVNGKGESIWLAMFTAYVTEKFADICAAVKNNEIATKLYSVSANLKTATDKYAWSNDRYLRCFYDDGTVMGKSGSQECEIDLLPQAWSVISDMPDKTRCETAVNTAYEKLVDEKNGVIKLFSPPFTYNGKQAGYVNLYPEGIRENGGQYTHGAVWLADAFFRLGKPERGCKLINILNPAKKMTTKYKTEPYYLAGDVYSKKGMEGRGGWSLYTGSAGWFYRTVYEQMLGIKQINGEIKIKPCLPNEFAKSRVKIISKNGTREFIL